MVPQLQTIVALSSGALPSGVAIVRISGPDVRVVLQQMAGGMCEPRRAFLRNINHPQTGEMIDQGLVLFFEGPNSFTGEDCLELQVHGGRAVVAALLDALLTLENVELAEAGEFSKRAFENGRLDLTEIEGLSDLIVAETEAQRRQALSQSLGTLRIQYEDWRKRLIHLRAMIEAELDFSEEEDIPTDISQEGLSRIDGVSREIHAHLNDNAAGEMIREGFKVALMGKPNAGKSSLLNVLAKRDVAIVTEEAGTTRDIIDVNLDIGGYAVIVSDTAGIRSSDNIVEKEGIRRAQLKGSEADMVIWLQAYGEDKSDEINSYEHGIEIISKDDDGSIKEQLSISSKTGYGIDKLIDLISQCIENRISDAESNLVTRKRHRKALEECVTYLVAASADHNGDIELRAESLRLASDCLGKIMGRIDVEDLLDVIFSEFCVGK